MPKKPNSITDNVMDEIRQGHLKMRPKFYFVSGSILVFISLILSALSSIFLFGLIRFSLRSHGPMGGYRLQQLVDSFPWWAVILAMVGLVIGLWLLSKYDFSYKINYKILVVGFIAAVIIAGYLVDLLGLNDAFYKRGYMNRIYRHSNDPGFMIDSVPRRMNFR